MMPAVVSVILMILASAIGAVLGLVGVAVRSFPLMLFGMALFGIASTSNLLARYAAADVSRPEQRGRAMGIIVAGAVTAKYASLSRCTSSEVPVKCNTG